MIFHYSFPLKKVLTFHVNRLEFPSPKDALCQVWLKLAHWLWRRRWKCEKFTDRRMDEQQALRKAHLSFHLRWAKTMNRGCPVRLTHWTLVLKKCVMDIFSFVSRVYTRYLQPLSSESFFSVITDLHCIARSTGTWHIYNAGKTLYRDQSRVEEF